MNIQITPKDVPKIAAVALILIVGVWVAVVKANKAESIRENREMITRMNREMGVQQVEFSDSTEERVKEQKEEDKREEASAFNPAKHQ